MEQQHVLGGAVHAAVWAHYERAMAFVVANFPLVPVTPIAYPKGLDQDAHYDGPVRYPVPPYVTTVKLGEAHQHRHYPALDENAIRWYVQDRDAVDFCSWTPSVRNPERLGFARVILSPRGGATHEEVAQAMRAVRRVLGDSEIEAIPVLDGFAGGALFIPFDDAPEYDKVRAWLHEVAETAVDRNEDLLTTDPHDQRSRRVHVNVGSNAVGRYSSLPYALIGSPHLGMVTPIEWHELDTLANGYYTATNSAERLARGDIFGEAASLLVDQAFGDGPR